MSSQKETLCGNHWLESGSPFKELIEEVAQFSGCYKSFSARLEKELREKKK